MTSATRKYMTDIENIDSEEEDNSNFLSSTNTNSSCEVIENTNTNDSLSYSPPEIKEADIENDDLIDCNLISKNQNLRTRYLVLQLYNYFSFIYDLFGSLSTMINAPAYSIIDYFLNFLGVSQRRINKKLIKNLLVLLILVIAFVHSTRRNTVYQTFETARLFPEHSIVTDFYKGELLHLRNHISSSDLTVVMFYAPWDRQSQNFASHFLAAAQYHHDQVTFVAINCWLPNSECKSHFKLHYYPIIIVQVKISAVDESYVIPYNGPLSSHHLIRFINDVLSPFTYISENSELLNLQLSSQAIVLGYYDLQQHKKEFLAFYLASINKLQNENLSGVNFAVVTNHQLAENLMFSKAPNIHLILWNTSVIFPNDVTMNAKNISSFIDFHLREVSNWLHISGKKSLSLNRVFQEGPFMVLFTPFNPYFYNNGQFQLLKSVALEYYNCENVSLQMWLSDHYYRKSRAEIRDLNLECKKLIKAHLLSSVSDILKEDHFDDFQFVEESTVNMCQIEEPKASAHFTWESLWNTFMKTDPLNLEGYCWRNKNPSSSCSNKNVSANEKTRQSPLRNQIKKMVLVQNGPREDDKVPTLISASSENHCKRFVLGSNLYSSDFVIKEEEYKFRINGLSCETNRTLKFIAIDSSLHADFASHIGLNLKEMSGKNPKLTGVVIIDPEKEERFVMEQKLTRDSLAMFAYNFTHNLLNRGKHIKNIPRNESFCSNEEVCIMELNAENYVKTISRPKQAFIALHYSHHCGACSAIGNVLLTCHHLTSDVSDLAFVRIDISKNTLPWYLSFDTVPTIVFHPHDKKSETRLFNPELPITVRNLMSFIISGLRVAERNALALKMCNVTCRKAARSQSLLMKMKLHHSLNIISHKLKRIVSLLVKIQIELVTNPSNILLQSKYNLLLEIKFYLIHKISMIKTKLSHLNKIDNLYPIVPSNYF